jgi:hypothetical protein
VQEMIRRNSEQVVCYLLINVYTIFITGLILSATFARVRLLGSMND